MWCNSDKAFSPDSIKSTLSIFHPTFLRSSQQHDAQEFFNFFVGRLQEDFNRIEKKAEIDEVKSNSKPDKQVALESWAVHLRRNQSIITDLMVGQSKLKMTCTSCS